MYSAEILADVRTHKHDIETQFLGIDANTRNAMLDRLVRDWYNDESMSSPLVSTHGKKYTNYESLTLLNAVLTDLTDKG